MSVSHIVDSLRHAAEEVGISADPMTKARNFVANLLFDRNYDQVKAAENARKFVQPQLDPLRTAKLIQESPHFAPLAKFCIAHFDAFMGHYEFIESVSSTNQAIRQGLIPPPPKVTLEQVKAMALEAESGGLELHRLPFTPTSLQQGPHLRFIREGHGLWHALFDAFYQDGTAVKTVEVDGAVFRYMEQEDEDEDAHEFLCQIYSDGHWKLAPAIHLISDEEDFGSTLNTLACWF